MPTVASTVVVQNRTSRAYFIDGVEVRAGQFGRVNPKSPFLAQLVQRGSFRIYEDAPKPAPVSEEGGESEQLSATTTKKPAAKTATSNKGDEE